MNNRTSSSCSKRAMLWLIAAGETPSLRAASEKLPFSAVVMKTMSAFKVSISGAIPEAIHAVLPDRLVWRAVGSFTELKLFIKTAYINSA
ncbi:hypothetical protein ABGV49_06235 [Chromobacterium vaccinii]|uniref:Uncharacterized protein n=1 Tax=Chromobacterium vaccinii TaxID=1108595 RepID=A0ABV0F9D0_9NEIS